MVLMPPIPLYDLVVDILKRSVPVFRLESLSKRLLAIRVQGDEHDEVVQRLNELDTTHGGVDQAGQRTGRQVGKEAQGGRWRLAGHEQIT